MAAPTELLNVNACLADGAVWGGHPVARLKAEVTYTDGRIQELNLAFPTSTAGPELDDDDDNSDPNDELTEKQKAIRKVVIETPAGTNITNDLIAKKCGWPNSKDLQEFVRTLVKSGLLERAKRGWTRTRLV